MKLPPQTNLDETEMKYFIKKLHGIHILWGSGVGAPDGDKKVLSKRICGFDSRLLLGPVIPKTFKNGSGLFLHGTHDEGGTTKHNWLARC